MCSELFLLQLSPSPPELDVERGGPGGAFFVLPEGAQLNPPRPALQSIVFTSDFERRVRFATYSIDLWIDCATLKQRKIVRANLAQRQNAVFVFRWPANSHQ